MVGEDKKKFEPVGVGGTNLTLDIQKGSGVIIVRDEKSPDKIEQIHIFTPLKMNSECLLGAKSYKFSCVVTPISGIKSMSDFPKVMTEELEDEILLALSNHARQRDYELGDFGTVPTVELDPVRFDITYHNDLRF